MQHDTSSDFWEAVNGQGGTIEKTKENLLQAIELILEDRKADFLRGIPEDAIQDTVMVG